MDVLNYGPTGWAHLADDAPVEDFVHNWDTAAAPLGWHCFVAVGVRSGRSILANSPGWIELVEPAGAGAAAGAAPAGTVHLTDLSPTGATTAAESTLSSGAPETSSPGRKAGVRLLRTPTEARTPGLPAGAMIPKPTASHPFCRSLTGTGPAIGPLEMLLAGTDPRLDSLEPA
ncbi:MAG: hypothetical protein AMJ81_14015 [Phycisphaerae bacterium SM23_33]|nr:MAG: hypothetical protein AMJ81_14015 [Phycisphaerae bacterium SM23_33]